MHEFGKLEINSRRSGRDRRLANTSEPGRDREDLAPRVRLVKRMSLGLRFTHWSAVATSRRRISVGPSKKPEMLIGSPRPLVAAMSTQAAPLEV